MTILAGDGSDSNNPEDPVVRFADEVTAVDIIESMLSRETTAISVSRLYRHAMTPPDVVDLEVEQALRQNADLRAAFANIVSRRAWGVSEVAMAAGSYEAIERTIRCSAPPLEHKLRIVTDRGRHFLILELDQRTDHDRQLVLSVVDRATGERVVNRLPRPVRGVIQQRLIGEHPIEMLLRRADNLVTLDLD